MHRKFPFPINTTLCYLVLAASLLSMVSCQKKNNFEIKEIQAHLGDPQAEYDISLAYRNGTGVQKNDLKALEWMKKAAIQGLLEAEFQLGYCYYYGIGTKTDPQEAVQWFQKAADKNHQLAQNYLGSAYLGGHGVTQDQAIAVQWFQKAAQSGSTAALINLGNAYHLSLIHISEPTRPY